MTVSSEQATNRLHGHVFKQFVDCVRHELERAQVHALVIAVLATAHVTVVLDDLAQVLWRQIRFLHTQTIVEQQ